MGLFDEAIARVDAYVAAMQAAGKQVREFADAGTAGRELPFRVGPGAGTGLVMKSETFVELGSPTAGSCAFALLTERPSLVRDGRVRLVGPDIPEAGPPDEAAGKLRGLGPLPFGQVLIAAGGSLTEADYGDLVESQYVGDQIEGFMVKSMPGRVWGRVSNDLARRGFAAESLGAALAELVRSRLPGATAVETLFVTSGKTDLQPLEEIGATVSLVARDIRERRWKARGIDIEECAFGGDCASCAERNVCDEVRKLAHARKVLLEGSRPGRAD